MCRGGALLNAAGLKKKPSPSERRFAEISKANPMPRILLSLDTIDGLPSPAEAEKVLALAERVPGELTLVGDAYYLTERYKEGLDVVDKVLKVAPKCPDAHHLGAEIAARKLDWPDLLARVNLAEKQLEKAKNFTIHRATALRD